MDQQSLDLKPDDSLENVFRESQSQLQTGVRQLQNLLESKKTEPKNIFTEWFKAMAAIEPKLKHHRIKWIWDTLRTDQRLRDYPKLNDAVFSFQDVVVFEKNTWLTLVVTKKHGSKKGPVPYGQHLPVLIQLHEHLVFKTGKSGKMDCRDCNCTVHIPVEEILDKRSQSKILSVEPEQIDELTHENKKILTVSAKSLNQAYTIASRKLEPKRKSHGGRIYDVAWYKEEDLQISLLDIREMAEHGSWEIPTESTVEDYSSAVGIQKKQKSPYS